MTITTIVGARQQRRRDCIDLYDGSGIAPE